MTEQLGWIDRSRANEIECNTGGCGGSRFWKGLSRMDAVP